ncbi:hypothetical protein FP435_00240 (plasmid) [Lactobacillus sp. PV037]|uniref:hypothetical protein n=1 Tax=Lactobacillus sp. PV037 TaxID=2594496 RepID=UPI00224043C4|nr:hypothetical protein [Lactobacillus sp. PV037]QNQ82967.1 hypothetical protein FP435_00240 [Lactobacillus sp. PV037]
MCKEEKIMANLSEANGTFSFEKNFYSKHQDLIDEYFKLAKESLIGEYGIYITKNNFDGSFDFDGIGRNSMYNTLSWCLAPASYQRYLADNTYEKVLKRKRTIDNYVESDVVPLEVILGLDEDEIIRVVDNPLNIDNKNLLKLTDLDKMFLKLIRVLVKEDSVINFEYKDFEPGSIFLVSENVTIKPSSKSQIKTSQIFEVVSYDSEDLGYNDNSIIENGFESGYDLHKEDDIKILISDCLEEWYESQDDNFRTNYVLEDIINALRVLSDEDNEYNGQFRSYRFEDEATISELVDDALYTVESIKEG